MGALFYWVLNNKKKEGNDKDQRVIKRGDKFIIMEEMCARLETFGLFSLLSILHILEKFPTWDDILEVI